MDYRVVFTQRALSDLSEIVGQIALDDGEAALQFSAGLLDHIGLLGRFPRMGNVVRRSSRVRKLVHSPVLVYYQVHEEERAIEILHFRHGARKAPTF